MYSLCVDGNEHGSGIHKQGAYGYLRSPRNRVGFGGTRGLLNPDHQ